MAKNDKKPTLAEITPELIKEWKGKYDAVFQFNSTDGVVGYFRNPDISEMEAATALMSQGHPIKSNKLLAESCFLGGDDATYKENKYLFGLSKKLSKLIVTVEGELEQL